MDTARTTALPALSAICEGEGPAVLLLHGIGSSATSWEPQLSRLGAAYRVIAPDLRGYGESPDPSGSPSIRAVVDDLAALVEREAPVHVVGVSFGALAALALARERPQLVRSLVLADATLGRGAAPAAEREAWRAGRHALAADLHDRAEARAHEIAAPDAGAATIDAIASAMRRARPSGYRYIVDVIAGLDATPWLGEICVPTLVLCGAHDAVTGLTVSSRIAEAVPDAQLATIAGAGHAPHVEQPAAFAQAVRAFIDGVESPSVVVRVALAGAGAIGSVLLEGMAQGLAGAARVVAIGEQPERLLAVTGRAACASATLVTDLAELPSYAPLVIEAAGEVVVRRYARGWIEAGADLMVLSAGPLADRRFRDDLVSVARARGRRLYVPSGAIAGIDGIRAAALGGLRSLRLRTTKPPRGLAGAPYIIEHGIDLDALTVRRAIFSGSVAEAIRGFPSNVNVSAIAALAGETADGVALDVVVVADPNADRNVHEIEATGDFGAFTIRLDNVPCAANPKTSALAPLSALAMVRRLSEPLWVGA